MDNETLFFIFGIALAVSAISFSIVGLKVKDFPGRAFPLVVLWFAILMGGATTFAVLHGKDEDQARAAETGKAGKEIEKEQTSGPYETEGAQGGGEEEAEQEAEAGEEGTEPVGPEEGPPGAGGAAGSKPTAAKGPGSTLKLAADPSELKYDTTSLSSKPGKVTIDFENPASLEHDVAIEQNGKEIATSPLITKGKTSVTAELAPGTYTFFCTVPGHREAGMEGTLVVK
jgi:plastocyanin